MAEVIGILAAAVEFTSTAIKLKNAWCDMKDAPTEVYALLEEVCLFDDMLSYFNTLNDFSPMSMDESTVWDRCCRVLQSSIKSINGVTIKLKTFLEWHKVTGRIRVYLKCHELTKCKNELRDTRSIMTAVLTAISTQQNVVHTTTLKEVKSIVTETQRGFKAIAVRTNTSQLLMATSNVNAELPVRQYGALSQSTRINTTESALIMSTVGSDMAQVHQQQADGKLVIRKTRKLQQSSTYHFSLPVWMYRKGLRVLVGMNNNSWGVTLRSYNQVPSTSDLFAYACAQDWDAVDRLICSGRASPYDIDENGTTLLHIAAFSMHLEVCKMLLDYGLDPVQEDAYGCSPLSILSTRTGYLYRDYHGIELQELDTLSFYMGYLPTKDYNFRPRDYSDQLMSIFSLFTKSPSMLVFDQETITRAMVVARLPPNIFAELKKMIYPSYEALSRLSRAELAIVNDWPDHELVLDMLGNDQNLQQAFQLLEDLKSRYSNRDLINKAAWHLGWLYEGLQYDTLAFEGWLYTLCQSMQFESQRADAFGDPGDIRHFMWGISLHRTKPTSFCSVEEDNDRLTKDIRTWVGLLQDCGVDLIEYGKQVKQRIPTPNGIHSFRCGGRHSAGKAIKHFTYGPRVEDWNVFVITLNWKADHEFDCGDDVYNVIGDFWCLIENPELFNVPGAYPSNEEQHSFDTDQRSWYEPFTWVALWKDIFPPKPASTIS